MTNKKDKGKNKEQKQIPCENNNKGGWGWESIRKGQQRIPCGNDDKKQNDKGWEWRTKCQSIASAFAGVLRFLGLRVGRIPYTQWQW